VNEQISQLNVSQNFAHPLMPLASLPIRHTHNSTLHRILIKSFANRHIRIRVLLPPLCQSHTIHHCTPRIFSPLQILKQGHMGHHHHHEDDTTLLTSNDSSNPGVRVTRIGLYSPHLT
jgi:hypothetical protein